MSAPKSPAHRYAPPSPRTRDRSRPRSSRSLSAGAHAGIAPSGPLQILAAAQPPPLMYAADAQRGDDPSAAACPCCVSRARRRPHPAEPAADQPRRFCRVRVAARPHRGFPSRVPVRLDARGFGVAGSGGSRGREAPAAARTHQLECHASRGAVAPRRRMIGGRLPSHAPTAVLTSSGTWFESRDPCLASVSGLPARQR